jgi:Na+-translocating ferredoxin:NAD+ oxidoreductase RNF subunit RnfB
MKAPALIYSRLQQHLDKQAVGFPGTRSRVELRILERIFEPREAEIATCLSYRLEPLDKVFQRARRLVDSPDELERVLSDILGKGGIACETKNGVRHYCLVPLIVGMFELQLSKLNTEFVQDLNEYTNDPRFGLELLSTKLPQMRTIPVEKSIRVQHKVSTFDEASSLLQNADPPFVVLGCVCRKKRAVEGHSCEKTHRQEICLAMGGSAESILLSGSGREITREEAASILEQNQKEGLVLQPSNTVKAEFICSCCGCCCGMLRMQKRLPKPLDFWASNHRAMVDESLCCGCGACVRRCQVDAVHLSADEKAVVDLRRCLGCGVCVVSCRNQAISLIKKNGDVRPPETRRDLYDQIMADKGGRLKKVKTAGKILTDAVRTGQTHLLQRPN